MQTAQKLLARDCALPLPEQKRLVQKCLSDDLRFESAKYAQLRLLQDDLDKEYLLRWSEAIQRDAAPGAERTSRSIAAHLLDKGFSRQFLHRWWTFKVVHEPMEKDLAALIRDAHALVRDSPRNYVVLLALTHMSGSTFSNIPGGLRQSDVSNWLRDEGHSARNLRQQGGVLVETVAMDPWSAAESAFEHIRKFATRIAVGTRERKLEIFHLAWVKGFQEAVRVGQTARGVDVLALRREQKLYPKRTDTSVVDQALELLEPLDRGSPASAVAGGWAAIETLLSTPGESKSNAARRLASLAALSFPRAELTTLSYRMKEAGLNAQLAKAGKNRERAAILADWIKRGKPLGDISATESAAISRMRQ
jgi:hypothetical protein